MYRRAHLDATPWFCYIIATIDPPLAEAIKTQLRVAYNAAADHFDDPPLTLWDDCGRRTLELANVRAGQRVLDVCRGSGASAIPAAERVRLALFERLAKEGIASITTDVLYARVVKAQ